MSLADIVKLGAVNPDFFYQQFFPRTVRQRSPEKHREIDAALDDPTQRYVNVRAFRGSAKTTKLRMFTARRIAYGVSRTVLYIGASEPHAMRSIQWLRNAIERNAKYAQTFGLVKGAKWNETEMEVINTVTGVSTWLLGVGITGNIRGINFDDYRPDLIMLDDTITDENAATKEQRNKLNDLILGAVKNSLAPSVEEPNAKIVNLQTPLHAEDASSLMMKDAEWNNIIFPCWTAETMDAPIEQQESSWPERFPSTQLRLDKRAAIARNKLSIFTREMECRLTSAETAAFLPDWLKRRNFLIPKLHSVLAIDPTPPPSDIAVAKGLIHLDYEAHVVAGMLGRDCHVQEYRMNRGHDPSWSMATAFELANRYEVRNIVVEDVAYQRTLQWLLKEEMRRRKQWFSVLPMKDRRSKFTRITSTLGDLASHGHLWIGPEMSEFIQAFFDYPSEPDDLLDATAMAVAHLIASGMSLGSSTDEIMRELDGTSGKDDDFTFHRGAP